jgi:hypothetical protein
MTDIVKYASLSLIGANTFLNIKKMIGEIY